jgi:hypothetical protein
MTISNAKSNIDNPIVSHMFSVATTQNVLFLTDLLDGAIFLQRLIRRYEVYLLCERLRTFHNLSSEIKKIKTNKIVWLEIHIFYVNLFNR